MIAMQKIYGAFLIILLVLLSGQIAGCEYLQTDESPEIVVFTINPNEVTVGGKATIIWNVTGALTVTIDPGIGAVPAAGVKEVSPVTTTTYTLTATNLAESVTESVILAVISEPEVEQTTPPEELPPAEPEQTAEHFYNEGVYLTEKERYEHAILAFDEALALEPDYSAAYHGRGLAYYYKGDCANAISDYTKAIELNADLVKAYFDRGMAYKMCHWQTEAVADFKKYIELSDDPALVEEAEKELQQLESQRDWY